MFPSVLHRHTHYKLKLGGNYRLCQISCKALWSGTLAEEQSAVGHVWNPALIAWRKESRGLWLRLWSAVCQTSSANSMYNGTNMASELCINNNDYMYLNINDSSDGPWQNEGEKNIQIKGTAGKRVKADKHRHSTTWLNWVPKSSMRKLV